MKIEIPKGSEIGKNKGNSIKIQVPSSKYWIQAEQREDKNWNVFLFNPKSTYKEKIKKVFTSKELTVYSGLVLKTEYPYIGKKAENNKLVKKFINKLIKNKQ